MSPSQRTLLDRKLAIRDWDETGEGAMMPALLEWLVRTGRLREQTQVALEVPWLGRRVDLALLNSKGTTTAFELKIGRIQRAIEQAAYNRSAFHRSWVVTGNRPKEQALGWAREFGIGIILVRGPSVSRLLMPGPPAPDVVAIRRLRSVIRRAQGAVRCRRLMASLTTWHTARLIRRPSVSFKGLTPGSSSPRRSLHFSARGRAVSS